jgi:hypothetical protein
MSQFNISQEHIDLVGYIWAQTEWGTTLSDVNDLDRELREKWPGLVDEESAELYGTRAGTFLVWWSLKGGYQILDKEAPNYYDAGEHGLKIEPMPEIIPYWQMVGEVLMSAEELAKIG